MATRAVLCALALCLSAAGCTETEDAPSVRRTCERLAALCGELLGFEASQCEAEAELDPMPTEQERRCIGKATTCDEAAACQSADGGVVVDAGAIPDESAAEGS